MCNSSLHEGEMDRSSFNRESMIEEKCGVQQQQMSETSQVSEKNGRFNTNDVRGSIYHVQCNVYGKSRRLSDISGRRVQQKA